MLEYKRGEYIFKEKQSADKVYLLKSGELNISKNFEIKRTKACGD